MSTGDEAGREVYLTTDDLATLIRTPPETCRYWRHMGNGPRHFKVGRRVLYARSDVDAWLREAREQGHSEAGA